MMHTAALLTWPKVKSLVEQGAIALLPIGSTEAHGPHLPLNVDVVIAEHVCAQVAQRLTGVECVMFPSVVYSLTDFAAPFAGTVSISRDTASAQLSEVVKGIAQSGFQLVALINHHLEPAHFSLVNRLQKTLVMEKCRLVVPDHRRAPTGPALGDEFMFGGSHAGNYETSLMLAAAPHLVDETIRRSLKDNPVELPAKIKAGALDFHQCGGPEAYFGTPASATAAEGQRLFSLLADFSADQIREALTR